VGSEGCLEERIRPYGHGVFVLRTLSHVPKSLELEAFLILKQSHGIEMPAISFEVVKISHQRQSFVLLPDWCWKCVGKSA